MLKNDNIQGEFRLDTIDRRYNYLYIYSWLFAVTALCAIPLPAFGEIVDKKTVYLPIESKKKSCKTLNRYLQLNEEFPEAFGPLGKWQNGDIEITLNPDLIRKIENQTRLRLISQGIQEIDAERWSTIGIISEDNYWIWLRDAVTFPSGVHGIYDRLMWKSGLDGAPGVGILALLATKKVIVNVAYRHATRSWEIELPRGQKKIGESNKKAAERELMEETGYHISKCTLLGSLSPDAGTMASIVPILCGEVSHSGETAKEYSEAISNNPAFTKEELKRGFLQGYMEIPINGEIIKVQCRDAHLSYAIFMAEIKDLL